jgi:uncharacterized protein Yka (UPF0111/DUF47 family)
MTAKARMISELGEQALLLPSLVNRALAANDRAKYYLSLLQAGAAHAERPGERAPDLHRERQVAGIADRTLDSVAEGTTVAGPGLYLVPRLGEIEGALFNSVRDMIAALGGPETARNGDVEFARRLESLRGGLQGSGENLLSSAHLTSLTSGIREQGDSLHLLVMDLHRRLNTLQAGIATESLDGARIYGLAAEHRPLVQAFMAGLRGTAELKFAHPGLGTTATEIDGVLVLQNDLGTTDVHLLIVRVSGLEVTVTYTDLHPERTAFFQRLFRTYGVHWTQPAARRAEGMTEEGYQLTVGTWTASAQAELERYLEFLGSRLVFVIDWNRARKRLRRFVRKRDCLRILDWAADHGVGHMGFLQMGGEQLVFEAIETSRVPVRPGDQLHEVLGSERAVEFLQFVLRTATEGLLRGRSEFLIHDEIRSELARDLYAARQTPLALAADHGTLIVELAECVRGSLDAALSGDPAVTARNAERARVWEHQADVLVNEARALARRWSQADALEHLLATADDVADDLEEAAFLASLNPGERAADDLRAALPELASCVVQGALEYRKALENARYLKGAGSRREFEDFLEAVDQVMAAEHRADDANRRVRTALLTQASDFRQLQVFGELARSLEASADGLMHAALVLRANLIVNPTP